MNIEPRPRFVIVSAPEEESKTRKSGIIVPDNTESEKKSVGDVIAVGSSVEGIEPGDRIVYGAYAGDDIKLNNQTYVIIEDEHILAVIRAEA